MADGKRRRKVALMEEYQTLAGMSRSLAAHRRNVDAVSRRIAKKMSPDLSSGLLENLDIVSSHIRKAAKELDSALKELKVI
jgi:uncharacterized protein YoaH (UPF0181 family)